MKLEHFPMEDIQFSTMSSDGTVSNIRYLKQTDMLKCPYCIIMPTHYRPDGTCKCNDPDHKEMAEWGYVWNPTLKTWEHSDEESEDGMAD